MAGLAQSGFAKPSNGFENQPPSFWSVKTCALFEQPAAPEASATAQTSAILETVLWRGKTVSPGRSIVLSLKPYFASARWHRARLDGLKG
jgi:hypothetical protein